MERRGKVVITSEMEAVFDRTVSGVGAPREAEAEPGRAGDDLGRDRWPA
jgi:hypothetical protein